MTLVDKHALTAALAELDAARAEVARLRAAVEGVEAECKRRGRRADSASATAPHGEYHDGRADAYHTAADLLRTALAATEDQP